MELKLKLKLANVFGGDGVSRPFQTEQLKLSRKKKSVMTRRDIGVPVSSEMDEQKTEIKEDICWTFKRDEDTTPTLRLGGVHGKLWGALKESAQILKDAKGTFDSFAGIDRLMKSINILPTYVRLENAKNIHVETLPQILAGRRSSMIVQNFDVISECEANVSVIFPDQLEPKVREMLEQLEQISFLNKRRATAKVETSSA